jgi:hypothetical protein
VYKAAGGEPRGRYWLEDQKQFAGPSLELLEAAFQQANAAIGSNFIDVWRNALGQAIDQTIPRKPRQRPS